MPTRLTFFFVYENVASKNTFLLFDILVNEVCGEVMYIVTNNNIGYDSN